MASKVYFTEGTAPEDALKAFRALGKELPGKIAIKVHSGEEGNQNYLAPDFWRPTVKAAGGTVVECNTAYPGERDSTEKHRKLIHEHGWDTFDFDLMDAEGPDDVLEIPDGNVIKKDYVGKNLKNYDSLLVLAHFKGHPMGGFGGALKQLSIGCASSHGKAYIHGAGSPDGDYFSTEQDLFLESMADAASAVVRRFNGNLAFVSVMKNLSVDCDCVAEAEDPCMKDIGTLASPDPVAIDQACLDLVYTSKDPGRDHLVERIERQHGIHTVEAAEALGIGSRKYELIRI
ncbi:DUF362 domain-containing protein [Methanomassiliicoccales archaeon LGM-DZ1]|nr:DUF362 domain-containing protein [Methanomassiliicoccales archaeon LGM-DZ1]